MLLYDRKIGEQKIISGRHGGARTALWAGLVLLVFFAADGLIFRTGWYNDYLEPDSSAGSLESHLYWLENARPPKAPQVLVVGDSRVGEGFSARLATSVAGQRLYFWNFGVAGTPPRVWYYALRDLDPTRRRFAAIAIAVDHYSDEDGVENPADRVIDQNYLVMRLGLGDCFSYAMSMESFANRHHAFFGCLFRGTMLRGDVQAFLADRNARIRHAEDWLGNGLVYNSDYGGKVEDLRGLSIDWASRTIHFPAGVNDRVLGEVQRALLPAPATTSGELARYRQRWLGGILDLYKASPTRIVFFQLPRAPLPKPESAAAAGFIQTASRAPNVAIIPPATFEDLERPELFADGLHLNRQGRPLFSSRLAERLASIVGSR